MGMLKMKFFRYLAITTMFWGIAPGANALTIDPTNCGSSADCESLLVAPGPSSPADEITRIESAFGVTGLSLYYKSEVPGKDDGPPVGIGLENDSAPFDDSYLTQFFDGVTLSNDPGRAIISWDGSPDPSISCPECFLYVKGGSQDPNVYMFNLGTLLDLAIWNGTESLVLTNFWSGNGAISHVAIYGVSPIPVPAAFWLFGTALIGFIGFSRRTKV